MKELENHTNTRKDNVTIKHLNNHERQISIPLWGRHTVVVGETEASPKGEQQEESSKEERAARRGGGALHTSSSNHYTKWRWWKNIR